MDVLGRRLQRAEGRVAVLERLIEDTSRDLYVAKLQVEAKSRFLVQVFEDIPGGLWLFDALGNLTMLNDASAKSTFAPRDEVIVRHFSDLFPEVDFCALLEGSTQFRTETTLWRKEREPLPIWFIASSFAEADGGPRSLICVSVDISERKQLEARLRSAQKLEAVGQLAAGVAHEINTPMQFIGDGVQFLSDCIGDLVGFIDICRSKLNELHASGRLTDAELEGIRDSEEALDVPFLAEEGPLAVERTVRGVGRVAEIVRALKAFSHPGDGAMAMADLNAALRDTTVMARGEYKNIAELELDLGEIPLVECRVGELSQVFLNLIVNAAHAIAARRGSDGGLGRIVVRSRLEADMVLISIEDDGAGIPESVQARLFEPFFTTKEVGKGTGQGLGIARAVVEKVHRGSLTFATRPGEGTTFYIRIPLRQTAASKAEMALHQEAAEEETAKESAE